MGIFLILPAATPACIAGGEHGEQQLKICNWPLAEQNTHETSKTSPQHVSSSRGVKCSSAQISPSKTSSGGTDLRGNTYACM